MDSSQRGVFYLTLAKAQVFVVTVLMLFMQETHHAQKPPTLNPNRTWNVSSVVAYSRLHSYLEMLLVLCAVNVSFLTTSILMDCLEENVTQRVNVLFA